MDDYSHCHYWEFKRACIGFDCDNCDYAREFYRKDSTCFSARKYGYEGDMDCDNCTKCRHTQCVYDSVPCNQCEKCFEDFGMIKCESCVNFNPEEPLWVKHKNCKYEKRKGYVRVQRYWNDEELDDDLFEL